MKLWNPPKTLEEIKKRAQISLLMLNIIIASVNLIILSTKLDTLGQRMVLYCSTVNYTDTICQEQ